jgi:hypothetical protein
MNIELYYTTWATDIKDFPSFA